MPVTSRCSQGVSFVRTADSSTGTGEDIRRDLRPIRSRPDARQAGRRLRHTEQDFHDFGRKALFMEGLFQVVDEMGAPTFADMTDLFFSRKAEMDTFQRQADP